MSDVFKGCSNLKKIRTYADYYNKLSKEGMFNDCSSVELEKV